MRSRPLKLSPIFMSLFALLALSGCDALVDKSRASASITGRAFSDATTVWSDVFTYHPPAPPQSPQTRYCYQMASDIVCYDSVQPGLTAKLAGYQDGDHMSWIQPGGGSLGASGGNPVALQPVVIGKAEDTLIIENKFPIEHTPVQETGKRGEIQTMDLPAR